MFTIVECIAKDGRLACGIGAECTGIIGLMVAVYIGYKAYRALFAD